MNNKLLYLTPLLCTLALDCSAQSSLLTHHCLPQDSIIYAKESAVFHPDKYYEAFDARYDVPTEQSLLPIAQAYTGTIPNLLEAIMG